MSIYRSRAGFWLISDDTHRTQWIEQKGSLNIDSFIDLICQHLKFGDVVVDVGANIGDHTWYYLEAVGEKGQVWAFEPDHEAFACLCLNCGWRSTFQQKGLGSKEQRAIVKRHANSGQNFVSVMDCGHGDIDIIPLDALGLERLDLLKIDVEGFELEVLLGAKNTIQKCRPILVVELIDSQLRRFDVSASSVIETIKDFGYKRIEDIRGGNGVSYDRCDIICFP